jgi:hypothetical protein
MAYHIAPASSARLSYHETYLRQPMSLFGRHSSTKCEQNAPIRQNQVLVQFEFNAESVR